MKNFFRTGLGSVTKALGGNPNISVENLHAWHALDAAIKQFIGNPKYEVFFWNCRLIAQKERGEIVKRDLQQNDDLTHNTRISLEWSIDGKTRHIYCRKQYASLIPTPREELCFRDNVSGWSSSHKNKGLITYVVDYNYRLGRHSKDPFSIYELIEEQFDESAKPRLNYWVHRY